MGEVKEMKIASKNEAKEKMSYEQLENIAHQMSEQSKQLYTQNQQLARALEAAEMSNFFKKLDYLWNIIHSESPYLTEEFKIKCGEEFMEAMSSKEAEEDNKE